MGQGEGKNTAAQSESQAFIVIIIIIPRYMDNGFYVSYCHHGKPITFLTLLQVNKILSHHNNETFISFLPLCVVLRKSLVPGEALVLPKACMTIDRNLSLVGLSGLLSDLTARRVSPKGNIDSPHIQ